MWAHLAARFSPRFSQPETDVLRLTAFFALLTLAWPLAAQTTPEAALSPEASGGDSLATPMPSILPDPTVEALAGLLLGMGDDPSLVGLRYRGAERVQFVVDGLRADGVEGLSLTGLRSLAVRSGYVPTSLGNALGGFAEVDTREAPRQRLGRAEGIGGLDTYGYGRASLSLGTETGGIRAYASGEFERAEDLDPRAYGTPTLPTDELDALRASPQVVRVDRAGADALGFSTAGVRYETADTYYVPLPGDLPAGASAEDLAAAIGLSDPSLLSPVPLSSLTLRSAEVPLADAAPGPGGERMRGHVALEAAPLDGLRLRLSGQGFREEGAAFRTFLALATPEAIPLVRDERLRGLFEADYDLGSATISLAASLASASRVQYDGRFSDQIEDAIRYGDIDDPANAAARAYVQYDPFSDTYVRRFEDGAINPASPYLTFASPGTTSLGYSREEATTARLLATARQRLGVIDLRFGVEAERSTLRGVSLSGASASRLARSIDDGAVELPAPQPNGSVDGIDGYEEFPYRGSVFSTGEILVYGYDYLGLERADEDTDLAAYAMSQAAPTFAPRRPSLVAGFAEGEWTLADLTLRGGVRLARFASNARALFDPYAAVELYRAGDLASGPIQDPLTGERIDVPTGGVPGSIPQDAALYVDGSTDQVVGYRDRTGAFFDASGAAAEPQDIAFIGRPVAVAGGSEFSEAVFADAPVTVRVLPRAEAVLRVGQGTSVSAFVNAFARQPDPEVAFPTLVQFERLRFGGAGTMPNGNLRPERLTEVGATLRQRLALSGGLRGDVSATAFYRLYRDRLRVETLGFAFPSSYTTVTNGGSANVPGLTARGSLASDRVSALGSVTVVDEPFEPSPSPFSEPLATETFLRVDAVAALAVALGSGDGPALGGFRPLAGLRVGGVLRYTSGDPYQEATRTGVPISALNPVAGPALRTPARFRLDLRLARGFEVGPSRLEASVAVENVLGRTNVLRVYPTTGLPDDDGFLASDPFQIQGLGTEIEREAYRSLYAARVRDPLNVGRPRLVRVALRLDI